MSWKCAVCGKAPSTGFNVSHSHRKTKRRWKPNLQVVRVAGENGINQKLKVCAKCIKAGKVTRAN